MARQAHLGFVVLVPNCHISKPYFSKSSIFLFCITILTIAGTSASTSAGNETDRLSLLAFKSKIVHDPQGVMDSWNDSLHFCDWRGVTCGRKHRRVTALDLSSSGLIGSLSSHIGNLSFLRDVSLQNNTLDGEIPREIGRLFRLEYLHLANNSLVGEIPAANLSRCTRLTFLNLGSNNFVGKIPVEFESLKNLRGLGLHFNGLTGSDFERLTV
ncbi:hypothetical protein TIFTF001_021756 [Ficus carica]|uniref:Leucine-rich repeat-containing N-terminal plant-type domain-containing protein n=1 Tax=Ficus carica TaxID=3494 RepID=A0AA88ASY1_FICCA|nr:hypothetical protein TIFTF001_021756 [Ficus carica]